METGLIGPTVAVVIFLVGGVGGYFTYKAKIDFLLGLVKDLRADHEAEVKNANDATKTIAALELRIEREFVKKDDLAAVEGRLGKRIETVEHTVRNTGTQILSAVSQMGGGRLARRAPE